MDEMKHSRQAWIDEPMASIKSLGWVEAQHLADSLGGQADGIFPRKLLSIEGVQIPLGFCTRCAQIVLDKSQARMKHRAWCRKVTLHYKRKAWER